MTGVLIQRERFVDSPPYWQERKSCDNRRRLEWWVQPQPKDCWGLLSKKAECRRIDAFELWCWRRLLRVLWTARRSNLSILKESTLTIHWKVKVKLLSCVRLFATPRTVAYQAPQSMGFSRQEYWSGLPFPSPGDLPNPGIEPGSPTLQADALSSEPPGKFDSNAKTRFKILLIHYFSKYLLCDYRCHTLY